MFKDIRVILALVVTVVITLLITFGGLTVMGWREGAIQNETRGETLKATSNIIADGTKADTKREGIDAGISAGKQQFNEDIQKGKQHEPETASRADRAVPISVRNAFKKRRLARERLGCIGEQCESGLEN